MNVRKRVTGRFLAIVLCVAFLASSGAVYGEETKLGVINIQKVLAVSDAGKKAQEVMEKKMEELQTVFKQDEDSLIALQKEIEKKSSAWSEEMKQEKSIEFQKKRRDLGVKQEDANIELKAMREQQIGPILKELEQVVKDVAVKEGFTVVIPKNTVLYASESVDLTEQVTKALNETMK